MLLTWAQNTIGWLDLTSKNLCLILILYFKNNLSGVTYLEGKAYHKLREILNAAGLGLTPKKVFWAKGQKKTSIFMFKLCLVCVCIESHFNQ